MRMTSADSQYGWRSAVESQKWAVGGVHTENGGCGMRRVITGIDKDRAQTDSGSLNGVRETMMETCLVMFFFSFKSHVVVFALYCLERKSFT